jgi:SHS2 domain-containing protein
LRADPDFEFVDAVTSDLSFVAHGATLEELFRAAAEALLAATVENPESVGVTERRTLALVEPDLELLLLRFLNELVYLRDAEALLLRPDELEISRDDEAHLEAELAGERIEPGRHRLAAEVKAATAHELRVEPDGDGWRASVTLDV